MGHRKQVMNLSLSPVTQEPHPSRCHQPWLTQATDFPSDSPVSAMGRWTPGTQVLHRRGADLHRESGVCMGEAKCDRNKASPTGQKEAKDGIGEEVTRCRNTVQYLHKGQVSGEGRWA